MMTIVHTPWSAAIHAGLTVLGFIHHREILYTAGTKGLHPLVVGPGFVGLVEPLVSFFQLFIFAVILRSPPSMCQKKGTTFDDAVRYARR